MSQVGRRNINLLTTAPTGTISTQACIAINQIRYHNTTSGIEPLFMISFTRRKKEILAILILEQILSIKMVIAGWNSKYTMNQ